MIRIGVLTCMVVWAGLMYPGTAGAVYQCGGVQDTCKCGKNNPYPCCDNGSNCTWWAWHMACCNWGQGLPGWGNANTWSSYASQNANFTVLSSPVVGAIATSTKGYYGHVAYVTGVGNGTVTVSEMNCCGTCAWGTGTKTYQTSYFNSGFVVPKGGGPAGPYCGNGKCDGGENCASCGKDCGSCCGNGACDHGENCSSCSSDCGSCCGNGACDWGESCSTCSKDCICLPAGSLDNVSCLQVRGWTWDTDSSTPVQVRVRVDGIDKGVVVANGPHPAHNGNGFVWEVPKELRDGITHQVQVEAMDTQSSGLTILGPKSFSCENKVISLGIWTLTHTDASGIQVSTSSLEQPTSTLTHTHVQDDPLAVSGQVQSCVTPTLQPFDGFRGRVEFNHPGGHFESDLSVDTTPILTSTAGSKTVQDVLVNLSGNTLCFTTKALNDSPAPLAESATLSDWGVRVGRWWTHYSADASGLVAGFPTADSVRVQLRPSPVDSPSFGTGWISASLPLAQAVHGVSAQLTTSSGGLSAVVPEWFFGDEVIPVKLGVDLATTQIPEGAKNIEFRVRVPDNNAAWPADFVMDLSHVRVHQIETRQNGAWWVEKHASYGFDAHIPAGISPFESGRCVVLEHVPPDWWSIGTVSATVDFSGPSFQRIRAVYSANLSEDGFQFAVYADKELVLSQKVIGKNEDIIDIPASGNSVTLALGIAEAREFAATAFVEFAKLEVLRDGWWSAPSPHCVGMRDDRLPGGGIRLENSKAWGILGNGVSGVNLVHRDFAEAQHGVRFSYSQDLSNEAYRIVVLLDGEPAQIVDEFGLFEADFVVDGVSFHNLGFAMVAKGQGGVYPYRWVADIDFIEVLGSDGQWRAVETTAPQTATADMQNTAAEAHSPGGIAKKITRDPSLPDSVPRSGGCTTSVPGGFSLPAWVLLLGVFFFRRRTVRSLTD